MTLQFSQHILFSRIPKRSSTALSIGEALLLILSSCPHYRPSFHCSKCCAGPGPVDIVIKLGEDVKRTRQSRSRFCMRFTPVEDICEASLESITAAAKSLVVPRFPEKDPEAPVQTFAVHYEHRASCNLDRLKLINAVLTEVKQVQNCLKSPPPLLLKTTTHTTPCF